MNKKKKKPHCIHLFLNYDNDIFGNATLLSVTLSNVTPNNF